jgi:AraC-like DNA-binding protein
MLPAGVCYREFAPCTALREHVRAYFSFAPPMDCRPTKRPVLLEVRFTGRDPLYAPIFADANISLSFSFEPGYTSAGRWQQVLRAPRADVIGPMTVAGAKALAGCPESAGVFLRAGRARGIVGAPAASLTNRAIALEDVWGPAAAGLSDELAGLGEEARIDRLESILLRRLTCAPAPANSLNVPAVARCILQTRGKVGIGELAGSAGLSRQHLTRSFREAVGITPKRFSRLARFQAGLAYTGFNANSDWVQAALELGYADQSHMIAEFREFCGLTPSDLSRQRWFHPFIARALQMRGPRV